MRHGFVAHLQACVAALLVACVSSLVLAGGAAAETYKVHETAEFVAAVAKANANSSANTIVLAAGTYGPEKTVTFTNTSGPLTIEGPSGSPSEKLEAAKLDGGAVVPNPSEFFVVDAGVSVTFKDVEITHGGGSGDVPTIEDLGSLGIESSIISGNTGDGVLVQRGATATVRNSTVSDGFDFGLVNEGTASFFNSTVAFNKNGGLESKGTLNLTNTIVAENTGSGDCTGKATTSDHSLDSDGSCGVGALSKTNPLLQTSPLNDGGSTTVHSLKPGSPAIGAGDPATCTTTDQRGAPRANPCSIGADEYSSVAPAIRVPAEITTPATGPSGAVVNYTASATSVNDVIRSFSCTPESGTTFAVGTTTVTCTAVDGHENKATASFKVTVVSCTANAYCVSFTPNNIEGSFKEPKALAVDPSGDTFVADSGHDRVLEFNSARAYLRQFGSEGTGEGQFKGIGGLATNKEGDVYVSDIGNGRVEEFSPTGAYLESFGSKGTFSGELWEPTGIAIDSSGNVWVRSTYGVLVQEFSSTGSYISGFGTAGWLGFTAGERGGLAISAGNLYVPGLTSVQEFSTLGELIRTFDEGGAPHGIASDPTSGNLYVTEPAKDRVQEFSAAGSAITTFGSAGSGAGQLSDPLGVAVASSGTVYVADTGNLRIEEWLF